MYLEIIQNRITYWINNKIEIRSFTLIIHAYVHTYEHVRTYVGVGVI